MADNTFTITGEKIAEYIQYLKSEERADNTIDKYTRDIRAFAAYLGGAPVTKEGAIAWKEILGATHGAASINSMLAAANGLFAYYGLGIRVKPLKTQTSFLPDGRVLTLDEYERLLWAAEAAGDERLYHMMQAMCATGARVGELRHFTVEAAAAGFAEVTNKGKTRVVLIPGELREGLLGYAKRQGIESGCIFVTKNGKPMDRTSVWRAMKRLCVAAGVDEAKVYPHSLRSLFSRMVHAEANDLAVLAELLGHSDINTTRVYVREGAAKYRAVVENLGLARRRWVT